MKDGVLDEVLRSVLGMIPLAISAGCHPFESIRIQTRWELAHYLTEDAAGRFVLGGTSAPALSERAQSTIRAWRRRPYNGRVLAPIRAEMSGSELCISAAPSTFYAAVGAAQRLEPTEATRLRLVAATRGVELVGGLLSAHAVLLTADGQLAWAVRGDTETSPHAYVPAAGGVLEYGGEARPDDLEHPERLRTPDPEVELRREALEELGPHMELAPGRSITGLFLYGAVDPDVEHASGQIGFSLLGRLHTSLSLDEVRARLDTSPGDREEVTRIDACPIGDVADLGELMTQRVAREPVRFTPLLLAAVALAFAERFGTATVAETLQAHCASVEEAITARLLERRLGQRGGRADRHSAA